MTFFIPELEYTFYGPIVLGSILIGIIVACVLMRRAGVESVTVLFTALFTFVCIIVCSIMTSIILLRDIHKIGFVAAGGAIGLMLGAVTSVLIHRDHIRDALTVWIIVAPLMYGLSKIGCHIAGCCYGVPYEGPFSIHYERYGGVGCFPIQLTETITFVLIFIIGMIVYLSGSESISHIRAAKVVIILSTIAKISQEHLREGHTGGLLSNYQILIFVIAVIAYISTVFISRMPSD